MTDDDITARSQRPTFIVLLLQARRSKEAGTEDRNCLRTVHEITATAAISNGKGCIVVQSRGVCSNSVDKAAGLHLDRSRYTILQGLRKESPCSSTYGFLFQNRGENRPMLHNQPTLCGIKSDRSENFQEKGVLSNVFECERFRTGRAGQQITAWAS
jgi:hypothetical protein